MPDIQSSTRAPEEKDLAVPTEPIWRLSVEQYHRMIQSGILTSDDHVELLGGWLVAKMVKNPPHRGVTRLVQRELERALPPGWDVDKESPITIWSEHSEPEPDVVVMRGDTRRYLDRHPGPEDLALVVEVSDTSLDRDRGAKKRLYAAGRVPVYWIVNLPESKVEVYRLPSGSGLSADYQLREEYGLPDAVPLLIDGGEVARILVKDLLP